MPLNKYDSRDLVSVPLSNGLIYVFSTNVDTVARTALGHTAVGDTVPPLAFQGGNSPKPDVFRRLTADGWNSSFCAQTAAARASAKAAGYKRAKRAIKSTRVPTSGSRATTVYVLVRGVKYAWNIPNESLATITQATASALGIEIATAADEETLVFGCSTPRPATATFFNAAGPDGGDQLTTFVAQAKEDSLPTGWRLVTPRIMFDGDSP